MRLALIATVLAIGCGRATSPAAGRAANFELVCDSANTATSAELQCVRNDTRTGDVVRIDYMQLPSTNGPTAAAASDPGTYTTACRATSMTSRADFYCIRMNTATGELMLINLQKVATIPAH
jgi:hypothetical protein